MGALGDSFYEYLLKSWLMTSKHDVEARDMYYESLSGIMKSLVKRTSNGLTYITDMKNGKPDSKMQHLVSFLLLVCVDLIFNANEERGVWHFLNFSNYYGYTLQ